MLRGQFLFNKDHNPLRKVTAHTMQKQQKRKKSTITVVICEGCSFLANDFDFKTAVSHSNAANFGTMAKIVDYMKKRHLSQQQWSLSLQEILDEIQVYDLAKKSEAWLKESLGDQIIVVPTQVNKRKDKVFFYNDPETDVAIEDDFKALWRNVSVDHLDEKKIEEYLQKHGIDAMKDLAPKKLFTGPPKRKAPKRRHNTKVHNEHLSGVLEDYE
uniref:Transcription initiation factor IIE subunit beta n=1 Tax=Heterorhabditis bacteriophora TaxID=37862 RepID=A0A1I7XUD5_HETBA